MQFLDVHARPISAGSIPDRETVVYPAAMRAIDVRQPLYGEDLERGDLRD